MVAAISQQPDTLRNEMILLAIERLRRIRLTLLCLARLQREALVGDFTKLSVWNKAHALTLGIYRATAAWPKHELFGLTSQAR